MWVSAQRFIDKAFRDRRVILYLGDHDPSGIDMTRDIRERMFLFGAEVEVKRIALTEAQIKKYNPPPNPTKLTDARAASYINKFGYECWELDALEPSVITSLIQEEVCSLVDFELFENVQLHEEIDKHNMQKIIDNYDMLLHYV